MSAEYAVNRSQRKRLRFIHSGFLLAGPKENRTERKVFLAEGSIRQDEFFLARQQGLKPKYMLYIHTADYKDEELLRYGGKVLSVYRSYKDEEKGLIELYLVEKKGEQ